MKRRWRHFRAMVLIYAASVGCFAVLVGGLEGLLRLLR